MNINKNIPINKILQPKKFKEDINPSINVSKKKLVINEDPFAMSEGLCSDSDDFESQKSTEASDTAYKNYAKNNSNKRETPFKLIDSFKINNNNSSNVPDLNSSSILNEKVIINNNINESIN